MTEVLPALRSADDGNPVVFAQGVGSPGSAGHHLVVHGYCQAALLSQSKLNEQIRKRLGVGGFSGRIVYVADHGNWESWQ
jgi:hypothetical protein